MTIRMAVVVAGVCAAAGLAAQAQEPKDPPKSKRNDTANVVPGPFRAQLVVDNRFPPKANPPKDDGDRDPRDRTGKMHDLVGEYGLSPVVAVFVRGDPSKVQPTDGLSKLLKGVDGLVPKYRADKLGAFAMFLRLEGGKKAVTVPGGDGGDTKVEVDLEYPHDEARAAKAAEVLAYARAVGANTVPFGLAADKSAALTAFGITDAPVTVIIYNRMRVVQRWTFDKADDLTDEKVTEILTATENMIRNRKP